MFSKFGSAVSLAKTQGGEVQNSSIGNHSHPNVFRGMHAPHVCRWLEIKELDIYFQFFKCAELEKLAKYDLRRA